MMIKEIIEIVEAKKGGKFHPIDVFGERWVITDGKDIFGENGEVRSIAQYKKDMKNIKVHDQWDYIYFPTEKLGNDALKNFEGGGKRLKKMKY